MEKNPSYSPSGEVIPLTGKIESEDDWKNLYTQVVEIKKKKPGAVLSGVYVAIVYK